MRPTATLRLALLGLLLGPLTAAAQVPNVTVTADITASTTWTSNNVYLIDGYIFVSAGVTLTIQPGTIVKARSAPTTGEAQTALIVRRGGRLVAEGTQAAPIVFTAEGDNVADLNDTGTGTAFRALWGGVVLLGRAPVNQGTGVVQFEAIPVGTEALYGCDNSQANPCVPNDDSGTLRYVSIRHGGAAFATAREFNGLTMNGVGSDTDIDHIEVVVNSDDCFEWFGGTVNASHLACSFAGDDSFDWDFGYVGKVQFAFSLQPNDETGRCFEMDNNVDVPAATPVSDPLFTNVTCIGSGTTGSVAGEANSPALLFRRNTAGNLYNSIFTEFRNLGVTIEDVAGSTVDSREQFAQGHLVLDNNIFWAFGAGSDFPAIVNGSDSALETAIAAENTFANPQLAAIDRTQGGILDPRPVLGGVAATGADFTPAPLATNTGGTNFFVQVDYRGAFAPTASVTSGSPATWLAGWTYLDRGNFLSGPAVPSEGGPGAGSAFGLGAVRPNPVRGTAAVAFVLDRAQAVRLVVYDVTGREVAVLADGTLGAGAQTASLDAAGLPAGVYVLRLQVEQHAVVQRLTVIH